MALVYVIAMAAVLARPADLLASPQDKADETPAPATEKPLPPLTGPRVPAADAFTEADQGPGTGITVTFTNNFISQRLPFDVPFNINGTTETAIKRVNLTVYRVPPRTNLAALNEYLQRTVDCVGTEAPGRQVSKSTAKTANGQFSVFVNALEPQYYYALCFVGVTPVDTTTLDEEMRQIVSDALAKFETEENISSAMVSEVRLWMRRQIQREGERRPARALIPDGNLFDDKSDARNDDKLADHAAALRTAYANAKTRFEGYDMRLAQLATDATAATAALSGVELPTDNALPAVESALAGNTGFDLEPFRFAAASKAIAAALPKADGPTAAGLRRVQGDLTALATFARNYQRDYDALRSAVVELLNEIALEVRNVDVALASSALGADLNRSAYASMDAGIAYPWRLENMVFYAGTNIYFRPINKRAPLRYAGTFLHRFALTVGVTTTVKDQSRRASDLRATPNAKDTSNSLLLGGGLRVTPSLRVGGGVLVFKESDPNPLVDQTSVAVTPYVAFTADINVAEIFRSLF